MMAAAQTSRPLSDPDDLAPVLALFEDRRPSDSPSSSPRGLLDAPRATEIRAMAESNATVIVLDEAEMGGFVTWLIRAVRFLHWVEGGDR